MYKDVKLLHRACTHLSQCLLLAALTVGGVVYGGGLGRLLYAALEDSRDLADHTIAAIWHADMVARLEPHIADHDERLELVSAVHREARRVGLQPELVLAVIEVESHFDRHARSKAGARGLMQVMPFWLREIGEPSDNLYDVGTNLRLGCTILKYYIDMENGDIGRALARYNGSTQTTRYGKKVFSAWNRHRVRS